jgi:hypothetical protein
MGYGVFMGFDKDFQKGSVVLLGGLWLQTVLLGWYLWYALSAIQELYFRDDQQRDR